MSTLNRLLQKSDPLRHEGPRLDAERDRIRQTVLAATGSGRPITPVRARLRMVAALAAAAIGFAVVGYLVWAHATTPVFAAVRIEVRLAEDQPMPGLVVAKIADSDRVIYLHPEVVVNNDDIAHSWVSQDGPDRFGVGVQFLPAGAARLKQASAGHLGRPVAVLVDGIVVTAPTVRSPMGDSAVITGQYTQAEAERIANGIATR